MQAANTLWHTLTQVFTYRKHAQSRLQQLACQQPVQIPLDAQHRNQPEYESQPQTQAYHTEKEGGTRTPQPV